MIWFCTTGEKSNLTFIECCCFSKEIQYSFYLWWNKPVYLRDCQHKYYNSYLGWTCLSFFFFFSAVKISINKVVRPDSGKYPSSGAHWQISARNLALHLTVELFTFHFQILLLANITLLCDGSSVYQVWLVGFALFPNGGVWVGLDW